MGAMRSAVILAVLPCVLPACSSSSPGPSPSEIIGEWRAEADAGSGTPCAALTSCSLISFYSNGTGANEELQGGHRTCISTWTWSFDGHTLSTTTPDGGGLVSHVTFAGDVMTLTGSNHPTVSYVRVSSSGDPNAC